jgi:hypothetical protein
MSTFGDLERAFADLYPYRWAFAAGVIVFMAGFFSYVYWKGWHRVVWRYRIRAGLIAAPVLAVTLWLGWSLGSPLFTNVTVDEAFPFAASAIVPENMDREEVEAIMSSLAKVESTVNAEMPAMSAKTGILQSSATPSSADSRVSTLAPDTPEAEPVSTPQPAETSAATGPVVLREGQFQDIDGFHKGSGTATVYEGLDGSLLLRLEDFKVTNGPELHVVLSPWGGPDGIGGRLQSPGWIDLGKLKGNIGNQNYTIPVDVDIEIHNSVTIWCKPFNVIFSVAVFQNGG